MKKTPALPRTATLPVAAVSLALASGVAFAAPADQALEGTRWVLAAINLGNNKVNLPGKNPPTLVFEQGRVSGFAGCNTFGGSFTRQNLELRVGPLVSTQKACAEPATNTLETRYLKFLAAAKRAVRSEKSLAILASSGELLVFRAEGAGAGAAGRPATAAPSGSAAAAAPAPQPATSLEGTWQLSEIRSGTAVTAPSGGARRPEITFRGGSVSGDAGCNRFSGQYTLEGARLALTPPVSTKMACADPAANRLETALLAGLGQVSGYRLEGAMLVLSASGGVELRFTRK
ncbi:heat shock protein HslJ [Deinobacterium chartae]|uniref:Heat shock protein HslJ n=1 Tax=Deinobacterium chartae TaxID=521158 RepID=A0A841I3B2_9DEIO|nr:META domain-containing protein [Deinobacterium chartae]MBB6099783.1 heat shock protein HslJ [Deinobacterium chartae]